MPTGDALFIKVLHLFAENFPNHAILKGGVSLQLLGSERFTNDLDYVFVPFSSKKEIAKKIEKVLKALPDSKVKISVNSKAIRALVITPEGEIQVEANVAEECKSDELSTGPMAENHNELPRVVRVMSFDQALANKVAAWNERRLIRDLYDIHFLYSRFKEIDLRTLDARLSKVESRIPKLSKKKKMSRKELVEALKEELQDLNEGRVSEQLAPLLPPGELPGLIPRMKASVTALIELLARNEDVNC